MALTNLHPPDAPAQPATGRDEAWDEAFLRVESYLRAHRVESRVLLNRLAMEIVEEARAMAVTRPEEPPVALALEVTRHRMRQWYASVFGREEFTDDKLRARGRLALALQGGEALRSFMTDEGVPPEKADGLRECGVLPGPEMRLRNMPPAPIELSTENGAVPRWPAPDREAFLRTAAIWIVMLAIMGAAWATSH